MTSGAMQYRDYWNDEAVERSKPWWIEDTNDTRLLEFLRVKTNLERCFRDGLSFVEQQFGPIRGTVLDLGAGVCWTSAILSRFPLVEKVHAVEYSRHRLFKIAPLVFLQYHAEEKKIEKHCEEMQLLRYPSESIDLVLFCQALYMTKSPVKILRDVFRILKVGGVVLVSCERISESPGWARCLWRGVRTLLCSPYEVMTNGFATAWADRSGRYDYQDSHYETYLAAAGFEFHLQSVEYPIFKNSPILGGNYIGVKRGCND